MNTNLSHEPLVVIFGGAGYVGSSLTRQLIENGYRVRVFDNFLFGTDGISDLPQDQLHLVEGNICDINAVASAVVDADIVVLLTAIVGHRLEDIKWFNTRNINFLASSAVLDAAREHGVSRFIFSSTDSVYGKQGGVLYETGTPEPVSLYSRLKLRMEERVMNAKRRSFHPTVLRLAHCYGYSPRMRFDLFANSLICDAVYKKEFSIIGEEWESLIHVQDAAQAFVNCIQAHENLISGEIFNVGAKEQNIQHNELAQIVKTLVPETEIQFLESEEDFVEYYLSCSKIEKILDFQAKRTIEDGLAELRDMLLEERFGDPYSLKFRNT